MIKLHLVPATEKKKRKELFLVFYAAGLLALLLLGMFIYWGQKKAELDETEKKLADENAQADRLTKEIGENDQYAVAKNNLDALKKTFGEVSEIQRKVLVAIDQLAVNLPDGIWLTNITQGQGNDMDKFTIQGLAVSIIEMKKYIANLQHPGSLLKEVTFDEKSISAAGAANNSSFKLHQFQISFRVIGAGT